ncbi:armadillo-like helical domain-containing protein 2 [Petaurus breviceps papuanus]|uniref:armadillo-like helical domain-containing protein 2 n=1 Tax=Petaurus breviceps papuanus TaxID=3040969 RepID=UPI0036DA41C2
MATQQNIFQRCMAAVNAMFMKIFSFFKNLCFKEKDERKASVIDSIFHKEKIIVLGYQLKNRTLPLERRAQAAFRLGLLAFTGGPMAATWVAEYMNEVVSILQKDDTPPHIKVLLLQSISSWCYLNILGQKKVRTINVIDILVDFLEKEPPNSQSKASTLLVKFWSCYLLAIIICNNSPVIRDLLQHSTLKLSLQILASENWQGWPENFAQVLFFLMGYHRS